MVSAKASSVYFNNLTDKVSTNKYSFELEYLGKENCVKFYKILSAKRNDSLDEGFINGEIIHNLKENTVQICYNGSLGGNSFVWNANLAPSKCNEKKYIGFRNNLNGLPGEGSTFELVFCK